MTAAKSDFKKSLYLNIGVILGVIAVFVLFFILLQLNIEKQISLITDIRTKESSATQSAENLSVLVKEWATAKNYSQRVSLLVPLKDDLVSLKTDINDIARQSNVSLSFNFGSDTPPVGAGSLGAIAFSATVDGSSDGILSFLNNIESKYYSLRIDVLELNALSGSLVRLTMTGQISYDVSSASAQ